MSLLTADELERVEKIIYLFRIDKTNDEITRIINIFLRDNYEEQSKRDKHLELIDEFFQYDPHFHDDVTLSLDDFNIRIKRYNDNPDHTTLISKLSEVSFPPDAGRRKKKSRKHRKHSRKYNKKSRKRRKKSRKRRKKRRKNTKTIVKKIVN